MRRLFAISILVVATGAFIACGDDGGGDDGGNNNNNNANGAAPVASFTMTPDCTSSNADPITFTNDSTDADTDKANWTCQWTFNQGTPPDSNLCDPPTVTFPHLNPYTVTLVVTDPEGNSDTATDTIDKCI
jgi:hypothetical protein